MRRIPVLAGLVVAAAAAVMAYLGFWQLERAAWKRDLLAELSAAPLQPPVNLDAMPLGEAANHPFRRAQVTCTVAGAQPDVRAGRNQAGATGYRYIVPCRAGVDGAPPALHVDIGWSRNPGALASVDLDARLTGILSSGGEEMPVFLTSDTAIAPLEASAPPSPEEIPDNHLFYAIQWFLFAGIAVIIFLIAALRRPRRRA